MWVRAIALMLVAAGILAPRAARAHPVTQHDPPAELRKLPYSGILPSCADPGVLSDVATRFAQRESEYWYSSLAIVHYDAVYETGYRTNGASYVPRRYCRATALFNDGAHRRIVYHIAEDLGFIGLTYGVTWCVAGLDRNHAYSPDCRAAGP